MADFEKSTSEFQKIKDENVSFIAKLEAENATKSDQLKKYLDKTLEIELAFVENQTIIDNLENQNYRQK